MQNEVFQNRSVTSAKNAPTPVRHINFKISQAIKLNDHSELAMRMPKSVGCKSLMFSYSDFEFA